MTIAIAATEATAATVAATGGDVVHALPATAEAPAVTTR
jgi:hypothetical protein